MAASAPIVTFASSKGGVGKSTLVSNVALELVRLGYPVRVGDLDVQASSVFHLGAVSEELSGGLLRVESMAPLVNDRARVAKKLTEMSQDAAGGIVLIDTPGQVNAAGTDSAMMMSDLVVVPMRPTPYDVDSANSNTLITLDRINQARGQDLKVLIVVSAYARSAAASTMIGYVDGLPWKRAKSLIPNATAFAESTLHSPARALWQMRNGVKANQSIVDLTQEILALLPTSAA